MKLDRTTIVSAIIAVAIPLSFGICCLAGVEAETLLVAFIGGPTTIAVGVSEWMDYKEGPDDYNGY